MRAREEVKYRGKVFGLQYKGLRRVGGGDEVDIFNLMIENSQNTGVHLKVAEEPRSRV